MRLLKILGLTLVVLVVLTLIIGLLQPTHYEYEKSMTINASKEAVFSQLNNFKNWEAWDPWSEKDSTIHVTYGEKIEGVGASRSWTSKNSGNGKMTIAESSVPSSLKTDLEFEGEGTGKGYFNLADAEGGGTNVTWGFSFDVSYPFNTFFALFYSAKMEKNMDEMFDSGLNKLKTIAESTPAKRSFDIQMVDFPAKSYLAIREKLAIDQSAMEAFFSKNYGILMGVIGSKKLEMDGPPSGVYYDWNEETKMTDMAAAIPVKNGKGVASDNIQLVELPASKALLIDFYGPYEGMEEAHYAMDDYLKKKNLKFKGPVIEEYVTDPGNEPDSSKWLTKIYYFYE